jgi:hypothetical protein
MDPLRARVSGNIDTVNANGILRTFNRNGAIDRQNPFFLSLGTNGRSCGSCHIAESGWTITPGEVRDRFEKTNGLDPIFRTNDGSVSPLADISTKEKRRKAFAMLLTRGLIRVGIAIPPNGEFDLVKVDDPYGFASAKELSLFRRPLPTTNVAFLSTVMWDGRETVPGQTIHLDLRTQANSATEGHAQSAAALTPAQRDAIVRFEEGMFTAQIRDWSAGDLRDDGAKGGPDLLSVQPFFLGINDPFGLNPTGAAFDPRVFTLYGAWSDLPRPRGHHCEDESDTRQREARESIARGEVLFNTLPIAITGVKGLNDELAVPTFSGHCTTCHDTPNVGHHSLPAPLDIGLTDASRRTPDMPLYTLRNKTTGALVSVTDPGRALISGRWKDIGRFKGPVLRGLSARAPYFHNGFAESLDAVVDFYDDRFKLLLTPAQKHDLVSFLRTL